MSEYPEHDRMAAVQEDSQAIGLFLDTTPYRLCQVINGQIVPVGLSIERILADYFGIDLDLIEREKRQMLATIRAGGHRG